MARNAENTVRSEGHDVEKAGHNALKEGHGVEKAGHDHVSA